jgi:hypothetical protein
MITMILTVVSFDLDWTSTIRERIVEQVIVVSRILANPRRLVVPQCPMFVMPAHGYNTDDLPIPQPIQ